MGKIEYLAVIKYLQLKGMIPSEIYKDMQVTLGEDAPSDARVKHRVKEFKQEKEGVEDDPRSARPSAATTLENVDLVLDMVMQDKRL